MQVILLACGYRLLNNDFLVSHAFAHTMDTVVTEGVALGNTECFSRRLNIFFYLSVEIFNNTTTFL